MAPGNLGMQGDLHAHVTHAGGLVEHHGLIGDLAKYEDAAEHFAGQLFETALHALHTDADGNVKGSHHLGSGLVTTAGVVLLAADWTNTTATLKLANYHDSGVGVTAAAIGDTAMQSTTGNQGARIAGTQTNPAGGQYRTVAVLIYGGTAAISEWGLFTTLASATMWDHKVFSAINVVNTDSITFTYTLTCTAGG